MKLLAMLLSLILGFFSLFLPIKDRTEWVIDGEYQAFTTKEKTFEKLMELAQANDVDGIYQVFSQTAKDENEALREQVEEFVRFVNEDMTSWEIDGFGQSSKDADHGKIVESRRMFAILHTDNVTYQCRIIDVPQDSYVPENVGFSSLLLFPEELTQDYRGLAESETGCYIIYQGEDSADRPMEDLMELASTGDTQGIHSLFSKTAQENTPDLQVQVDDLTTFLQQEVTSWDFYTWTTEQRNIDGMEVTMRQWMLTLHTDKQVYRCNIRDMVSDTGENLGIYSIAVYPDRLFEIRGEIFRVWEYQLLGRDETGVFRKVLTIEPETEQLIGVGIPHTVRLITSVEASSVTCSDSTPISKPKGIVITKIDELTWEVTLPPIEYNMKYIFTATTDTESSSCEVTTWEK